VPVCSVKFCRLTCGNQTLATMISDASSRYTCADELQRSALSATSQLFVTALTKITFVIYLLNVVLFDEYMTDYRHT